MGLRIALFGQAAFGRDVLAGLIEAGHEIAAVYAPPEGARPDPLAELARERGLPLLRHRRFRRKRAAGFEADPEILAEYRGLRAELNVLAYVTAILPPEIVGAPMRRSLCFHPSLLPRFRGGSALAWQIILGEKVSGVTVFEPDAGVDTGPIVVQRGGVPILDTDTAGSLYFDKLYPLGVAAMLEAVAAVADGSARPVAQDEARASFQGLLGEAEARIDWARPAAELDRLVRGCDPQPGAWASLDGEPLRLFDGRLLAGAPGALPGTLLGFEGGRLVVAARDGRLAAGRVRRGAGPKQPAVEAGLAAGARLA
jgi:methionyl-tRNA formyltransferase